MMQQSLPRYFVLFWLIFLVSSVGFSQQNRTQNITATTLGLSPDGAHNITIQQTPANEYQLQTTGHDPYLFTVPLTKSNSPANTVLTFEYFCVTGIDRFQVFMGPPITENHSKTVSLPLSEGWTTFSLNLKNELQSWGREGDILRLDFGNDPNRKIQIRNIYLRPLTAREQEQAANKTRKLALEARLEKDINTYLTQKFPAKLTEIVVTAANISISGNIGELTKNIYLAPIPINQNISDNPIFPQPLKIIPSKNKRFQVTIARYISSQLGRQDRLLCKWVLVQKVGSGYKIISAGRYADELKTAFNLPLEKPKNKKGLGGFTIGNKAPISDLDSLGISSVTVNIILNQLLRAHPSGNTISFTYNNKIFYADKSWVFAHDKIFRETAQRAIIVSAIILVQKAVNSSDKEIGRLLEHPDCDPAGIYSMPNLTSAEGVEYFAAALDFLASRYSRPDNKYGRIHHYIAHNEVDAGWEWTNMGEKTPLLFMDTYHKSMRILHLIARQYNPHAQVFISLTHFWNFTPDKHFYRSRHLLELLQQYSKTEGDFDWAIAQHPYPENLFEPKVWQDKQVNFTFNTPLITYKNIEVLNAWVNIPANLYLGKKPRTIHLSEQGLNAREYTDKDLQEQAAGMAYAWQKIKNLKNIEAFQYHNWMDNRGEGGLRIGLRRFPDDSEFPVGPKPIWHLYKNLQTSHEDKASAFALPIIGIKDWSEIIYKGKIE